MTHYAKPLALGVIAALIAGASLLNRFQDTGLKKQPVEHICCGVAHPTIGDGMACAQSPQEIIPTAIRRLNLPSACSKILIPPNIQTGCRVVLDQQGETCSLKAIEELRGAKRLLTGAGLDINTATAADLTLLPGIGEVKANAIVKYRQENGPFQSPEDLVQVRGIGEKTVARLTPFVRTADEPARKNEEK